MKVDFVPDTSAMQRPQDGRTLSAGTLASAAHARVRAEILSGVIAPGSRLHIRELCGRLGIGLSPMREALNRLSAQGLVKQSDQRGFTAAPLDLADLADLQGRAARRRDALIDHRWPIDADDVEIAVRRRSPAQTPAARIARVNDAA